MIIKAVQRHSAPPDYAWATGYGDAGLVCLSDQDLASLQAKLEHSPSQDTYLKSVLYFALTGRGHVWMVRHQDRFLLCTAHPNMKNMLLVFFPFASHAQDYYEQIESLWLHSEFLIPYERILLARIPQVLSDELLASEKILCLGVVRLHRFSEHRLDWVYPSYDVSLDRLVDREGHDLAVYRKKSRKCNHHDIGVIPLEHMTLSCIKDAIVDVNVRWVSHKILSSRGQGLYSDYQSLIEPYIRLAELVSDQVFPLDGLFLKRGKHCIGLGIWGSPTRLNQTVPCLAAMTAGQEVGLSEYLYFQIAQKLVAQGYQTMCIGGSETESLDRFKRKLAPVAAYELCMLELTIH
jgi:hypothetical protein